MLRSLMLPLTSVPVDKFEVNSVAIAGHLIVRDRNSGGRPEVDAVAGRRLSAPDRGQNISFHSATRDIRQIDTEESFLDPVTDDRAVPGIRYADGCPIFHVAVSNSREYETLKGHVIG